MNTRATTWAAGIAAVLVLTASGTASASSVLLSPNSCLGKNTLEGGLHRGSSAVSAEACRGWADYSSCDAAGLFVAPVHQAAPDPPQLFNPPLPTRFQRPGAGIQPPNPQARMFGPNLPDGTYAYVQAPNGQVVVGPAQGHVHPGILGNGMPAAGAGQITVQGGVVTMVDNVSGTFQFGPGTLPNVVRALELQGGTVAPNAAQPFRWR
jgi:hypothetical protein